jgi:hypothetical protein
MRSSPVSLPSIPLIITLAIKWRLPDSDILKSIVGSPIRRPEIGVEYEETTN